MLKGRSIYRRTLKRIPLVRSIVVYALSFTPQICNFRNNLFIKIKRPELKRIISTRNAGTQEKVLFPASDTHIPFTPCYGAKDLNHHIEEETAHFPQVALYHLPNATVRGKSHFLTTEDNIVTHQLGNITHDMFNEELKGNLLVNAADQTGCWEKSILPQRALVNAAAVFTDAWSHNYAHFVTEVLPRIAVFCSQKEYSGVPLLIDANLHENCNQAIRSIAGEKRVILSLTEHETLLISNAYCVDHLGYIPFEARGLKRRHDGSFSKEGISCLNASTASCDFPKLHTPKKVFLRRNSGLRNIANAHEVEQCFTEHGFTIIEPEKLSFLEQVAVMRHADVVAGATGAAMANFIFCKPGTQIIVLLGQHKAMPYGYWRGLAASAQCNLTYIFGRINGTFNSFHSDYTVSSSAIQAALSTKKTALT